MAGYDINVLGSFSFRDGFGVQISRAETILPQEFNNYKSAMLMRHKSVFKKTEQVTIGYSGFSIHKLAKEHPFSEEIYTELSKNFVWFLHYHALESEEISLSEREKVIFREHFLKHKRLRELSKLALKSLKRIERGNKGLFFFGKIFFFKSRRCERNNGKRTNIFQKSFGKGFSKKIFFMRFE